MGIESDLRELVLLRALAQEDDFSRAKAAAVSMASAAPGFKNATEILQKAISVIFNSGLLGAQEKTEKSKQFNIFEHPDLLEQALEKIEELVKKEKINTLKNV